MVLGYIDLKAFRKDNGLKQEDVANFLGTSRSFIGLVETKMSNLPEAKIDLLLDDSPTSMGWIVSSLVPAYTRIMNLHEFLLRVDSEYAYDHRKEFNPRPVKPSLDLSPAALKQIKHGRFGISEDLADIIIKRFPRVLINKQWLLYGEGSMIRDTSLEDSLSQMNANLSHLTSVIEGLQLKIRSLESDIDKINRKIGGE